MTSRAVLSPSAKVGITTVAVTIVVIMVGFFFGWWTRKSKDGFELWIHFDNIRGLTRDAEVLINGAPVGRVMYWDPAEDKGLNVQVRINDPKLRIHQNASVVITAESVLGKKVISITQPTSGIPVYVEEPGKPRRWENPQEPVYRFEAGTMAVGNQIFRMLGAKPIRLGEVISVTPDSPGHDRVTLRLEGEPIQPEESLFPSRIAGVPGTVGMLYPPVPSGEYLKGTKEPEASDIISSVNDVVREINGLISTLSPQIQSITGHLDEVLVSVRDMLDKNQVDALFTALERELTDTGRNIDLITNDLRGLISSTEPGLLRTLGHAEASAANVESITGEMNSFIADPAKRAQIESMLTQLEQSSARINAILEDIESLTGDEQVQTDLKGTISTARSVLQQADTTLQKVNQATASLGGHELGVMLRQRYEVESRQSYTDARLQLDKPKEYQLYLGASDIGEGGKLDLGYGWYLGENVVARGGLRRGKPGVGADLYFDPFRLSTDLYDANDLRLDINGTWFFDEQLGLYVGLDDVLDEGTDRVNVGATLKF